MSILGGKDDFWGLEGGIIHGVRRPISMSWNTRCQGCQMYQILDIFRWNKTVDWLLKVDQVSTLKP